ncbi:hypothetical protein BDA96_07G117000 [Sorghum bicolor]|nr:hypothetical protein BDA96_07G117000 [Sorghum bicolor]
MRSLVDSSSSSSSRLLKQLLKIKVCRLLFNPRRLLQRRRPNYGVEGSALWRCKRENIHECMSYC